MLKPTTRYNLTAKNLKYCKQGDKVAKPCLLGVPFAEKKFVYKIIATVKNYSNF